MTGRLPSPGLTRQPCNHAVWFGSESGVLSYGGLHEQINVYVLRQSDGTRYQAAKKYVQYPHDLVELGRCLTKNNLRMPGTGTSLHDG